MKLLSQEQTQACESLSATALGLPLRTFMEHAGRAIAAWVRDRAAVETGAEIACGVTFVCGAGNNGGDGFVAARFLRGWGVPVTIVALTPVEMLKGDARASADAFLRAGGQIDVYSGTGPLLLPTSSKQGEVPRGNRPGLIVDCIFGIGLNREVAGSYAAAIGEINSSGLPVLSADIPSGIAADTGAVLTTAVKAAATLTFHSLKRGHVLGKGAALSGTVWVADVGLIEPPNLLAPELITPELLGSRFSAAPLDATLVHKGTKGHVLVIGGSPGRYGAVKLCCRAAFKAGAGLVTAVVPKGAHLFGTLYETMGHELPDDGNGYFSGERDPGFQDLLERADAVVIGMGMGRGAGAKRLACDVIRECDERVIPCVIDADALDCMADFAGVLTTSERVVTPHPGEMARLLSRLTEDERFPLSQLGREPASADVQAHRFIVAEWCARELKTWTVLKGAFSIVAGPGGESFVSPVASAALATAGSGDVLAGAIGGLLAQGLPCDSAACTGVAAHGIAPSTSGDVPGLLAGDIADALPAALCRVQESCRKRTRPSCERYLPGLFL